MASGLHLEQYLDSVENLPTELQRNFNQMRELDQKCQDLMRNIDQLSDDYLTSVRAMSPEKKTEQMSRIQKMFNRAKEYSDDKVQLAIQTYEMVDKHIRRLDSDLAKFEAEIKEKALGTIKKEDEAIIKKKGRKKREEKGKLKKKGNQSEEEEDLPKNVVRKKKCKGEMESAIASVLPALIQAHSAEVLDMPVDPNEPTYCLCHQVSYGEMIACDKADCPIEWFHFACVGLTTKPKGKWYCPKCSSEIKKKKS